MLTDLFQPWRLAVLAFACAVFGIFVAAPGRLEAQADAVVVLAVTLETPVIEKAVTTFTGEPDVEEIVVAGAPTTLARPAGTGPWPVLVVVNGATEQGRRHPALQRLARGLARAGYLVLVPDLPGLTRGALTEETVAATVDVALAAAGRSDSDGRRVGLLGVSVGTSLALLAAEDPALAERVSVITGTAPYADLANVVRLATTGYYRAGNLLIPYETDGFLAVAVARSLAGVLAPGTERDRLLAELARLDDDAADPLAPLHAIPLDALDPDTRTVVALLANDDPRRFDELYAAVPAELRAVIERLSPVEEAERITAPVELASAPDDRYVPPAEAHALARAARRARVTVTETLGHAVPNPSLSDLGDLLRFNGWVVRSLEGASG